MNKLFSFFIAIIFFVGSPLFGGKMIKKSKDARESEALAIDSKHKNQKNNEEKNIPITDRGIAVRGPLILPVVQRNPVLAVRRPLGLRVPLRHPRNQPFQN